MGCFHLQTKNGKDMLLKTQPTPRVKTENIQASLKGRQPQAVFSQLQISIGRRGTLSREFIQKQPEQKQENPSFFSEFSDNKQSAPVDTRIKVQNSSIYPHSAIGLLSISFGYGNRFIGTGFLISENNFILTCAHNCYKRSLKKEAEEIIFYPGKSNLKGEAFIVHKCYYDAKYCYTIGQESNKYDFALLQLKQKDVGKKYGYFSLDFRGVFQGQKEVFICGYPARITVQGSDKKNRNEQYFEKGSCVVYYKDSNLLQYEIPTSKGQSGSPIYYLDNNQYYVIGIHMDGSKGAKLQNRGILLQKSVRIAIKGWINSRKRQQEEMETPTQSLITPKQNQNPEKLNCKTLWLQNKEIKKIPPDIELYTELEELQLWSNQIETIPEYLCKLSKLKKLSLQRNYIYDLPDSIGQLSRLQHFNISFNKIKELPQSIGNLQRLKVFYAYDNKITQIPESIRSLILLEEFKISSNQLTVIPPSIGNLKILKKLSLFNNKIVQIPQSIGLLEELLQLRINSNKIKSIPESIEGMSKLKFFYIFSNQIKEIPKKIKFLKSLEIFDISSNLLEQIPQEIAQMTKLKSLNISENEITEIPQIIASMKQLEQIIFTSNKIIEISQALLSSTIILRIK